MRFKTGSVVWQIAVWELWWSPQADQKLWRRRGRPSKLWWSYSISTQCSTKCCSTRSSNRLHFPYRCWRDAKVSLINYTQLTHFPSLNLREDFNDFAIRHGLYDKNENAMTVFVVPVFEKKKGSTCPDNKRELAESCDKNEVRSFHEEVNISLRPDFRIQTCKWCHEPEQPKKWLQIQGQSRLEISFNSSWTKSWEPFYIASRQVPYFDEVKFFLAIAKKMI